MGGGRGGGEKECHVFFIIIKKGIYNYEIVKCDYA